MTGLDASSFEKASAGSPLHAFSLPSLDAVTQAASVDGRVWPASLDDPDRRTQVARKDLLRHRSDPRTVAIEAKRHLDGVQRDLLAVWKQPGASRGSVLRCAAVPLECSARVWQAFGPVAGKRHRHLLRRSQETLAAADREIRAAELPLLVNRPMISQTASAARAAIDDLLDAATDRAEALASLEDAAVALASLAVRVARNLNKIGSARRPPTNQPTAMGAQLEALAGEVSSAAAAQQYLWGADDEEGHLGVWLSSTLSIAAPTEAIELTSQHIGEPYPRADALFTLRARWLELAVGLWLIVQALDDLLVVGTFGEAQRLNAAVSSRAGIALVACDLHQRPGEFDHGHAWDRQRGALYKLVSDICLALQTCEPDALLHSQQFALRRLARALAAIWTIDERVRSPLSQASRRCR